VEGVVLNALANERGFAAYFESARSAIRMASSSEKPIHL